MVGHLSPPGAWDFGARVAKHWVGMCGPHVERCIWGRGINVDRDAILLPVSFFFFSLGGMEPRVFNMLGKLYTVEPHSRPSLGDSRQMFYH